MPNRIDRNEEEPDSPSAPSYPDKIAQADGLQQIDHNQIWRGSQDDVLSGGNEAIQRIPEDDYDEVLYEEEDRKYHQADCKSRA